MLFKYLLSSKSWQCCYRYIKIFLRIETSSWFTRLFFSRSNMYRVLSLFPNCIIFLIRPFFLINSFLVSSSLKINESLLTHKKSSFYFFKWWTILHFIRSCHWKFKKNINWAGQDTFCTKNKKRFVHTSSCLSTRTTSMKVWKWCETPERCWKNLKKGT